MSPSRMFRAEENLWLLRRIREVVILGASLLTTACAVSPLMDYSTDVPAAALMPVSQTSIVDGRSRFRAILCALTADHGDRFPDKRPCDQVLHRLTDEPVASDNKAVAGNKFVPMTVVFVPGIFGECVEKTVMPFSDAYPYLQSLGYDVQPVHLSGRSSSAHNAAMLRDFIQKLSSPNIVLVAYSKGVPDTLEMLVKYPEARSKIRAVVSVAGVVSGSPIADGFADLYAALAKDLPLSPCPPGDGLAVNSLRRTDRLAWLAANKLPDSIRYYSLAAFAPGDGISAPLKPFHRMLSHVDPRNDGQVIYSDAIIPGSTLLGFVNADHWAVTLPFGHSEPRWKWAIIDRNAFPREILIESVLSFVQETL